MDAEIDRLLGQTEALLDREEGVRSRVRSLSTASRTLIAAAAAVLMVGVVVVFARRSDLGALPAWQLVLAAAFYGAPLGCVVWLLLSPLYHVEARPREAVALLAAGFGLPFVGAFLPSLVFAHGEGPTRHGCLLLGLGLGGLFIGLLRAMDRAADRDPRSLALGAAAGGLVANLALTFYCPETRVLHLAIAHAPLGFLLLFLYRRALRLPRRRAV
jgi:hypothetical protein